MRLYYNSAAANEEEVWVRVSAIVGFPTISSKANCYGYCVAIIRDFEGALYATWSARDFTEMKVTDDAGTPNTIFRGYLKNKKFHARDLILEIAGIGEILERKSFGSEEGYNEQGYILAEGKVAVLNANSTIDLYDDLDDDDVYDPGDDPTETFAWTPDVWISGDKDVGLMIVDNTSGYSTVTWPSTGVVIDGENSSGGNNASILEFDDGDYLWAKETGQTPDLVITPTIDGADIDGTGAGRKYLKQIEIRYSFRGKIKGYSAVDITRATIKLQIYNAGTSEWEDIAIIPMERYWLTTHTTNWVNGLPIGQEGSTVSPKVISGTDAELQNYLKKPGDDYTELEGLRFKLYSSTLLHDPSYAVIYVDYISVVISYSEFDVEPVMYRITGNAASQLTCAEVANFQQMGITAPSDVFQIGENTRKILQDISTAAGIAITVLPEKDTTLRPNQTVATGWASLMDIYSTFDEETPDNIVCLGDNGAGDDNLFFTLGFDTLTNIRTNTITEVTVNVYGRCYTFANQGDAELDLSFDAGVGWEGVQSIGFTSTTNEWKEVTFTGLTESSVDDLQLKVIADVPNANDGVVIDTINISVVYKWDGWALNKYMARKFKGKHCIDVLESICKLEGAHWVEDYVNNRIKVLKPADYKDSGESLAGGGFTGWEYEDKCNQVSKIFVWGKTSYNPISKITTNIFYKAINTSVEGGASKQVIDDTITNIADAEEVAKTQLALYENKRPSIRIPLKGVNIAIQLGTYVELTMVSPTVAAADYKVRMIERGRFGKTEIFTIVHCGLGETQWDEKFERTIKKLQSDVHRIKSERLTSTPYETGVGGITWGDITGGTTAVENIITAEIVDGQSIDNAIDTLIAAAISDVAYNQATWNANPDAATKNAIRDKIEAMSTLIAANCTQAEVETIITTECGAGQSIDNTIDALIAAHHDAACADHDDRYYSEAEIDALDIHTRLHAITNVLDHNAGNWKMLFTNGAGQIVELALGAATLQLTANGVAAAPTWEAAGGGGGGDDLGNHTLTEDLILAGFNIGSSGIIRIEPEGTDGEGILLREGYSNNAFGPCMYREGATTSAERGRLGFYHPTAYPFQNLYVQYAYDDDGTLGAYSEVDDLQLLREIKEYGREKPLCPDKFPNRKQKVWDMNTLPWIKAHPDVNALANDNNDKRYSLAIGARDGYLLSTMKRLLEEIDILKLKVSDLESEKS